MESRNGFCIRNDLIPWHLTAKAEKWFTSAAAADPTLSNNKLIVSFGGQCFEHAATKKVD